MNSVISNHMWDFERCVQEVLGSNMTSVDHTIYVVDIGNGNHNQYIEYIWDFAEQINIEELDHQTVANLNECIRRYANSTTISTCAYVCDSNCELLDLVHRHCMAVYESQTAINRRQSRVEFTGCSSTKFNANDIWTDVADMGRQCHNTDGRKGNIGESAFYASFGPTRANIMAWNHHDCRKGKFINTPLVQGKGRRLF